MADKCDPIRARLQELMEQRKNTEQFLDPPIEGEHHAPKPKVNKEWVRLNNLIGNASRALQACEESLIDNTPVPLELRLIKFTCIDQNDIDIGFFGIDFEDDEPYAVVFATDTRATSVIGAPTGALNSRMTLVGALSDVDEGEEYLAPFNVIWGLSNTPSLVSSADSLFILVTMMEKDSGSPDQVRTVLETAAQIRLLANVGLLVTGTITREEFVRRIVEGMNGAMQLAELGAPDPEDKIGPVQELRFSQAELDHIYRNLGPVEKSLSFEGNDAKYLLTFRMFR